VTLSVFVKIIHRKKPLLKVAFWDVMEAIAPEGEWKHQNGKFAGLN
jgi:hypothetical protein